MRLFSCLIATSTDRLWTPWLSRGADRGRASSGPRSSSPRRPAAPTPTWLPPPVPGRPRDSSTPPTSRPPDADGSTAPGRHRPGSGVDRLGAAAPGRRSGRAVGVAAAAGRARGRRDGARVRCRLRTEVAQRRPGRRPQDRRHPARAGRDAAGRGGGHRRRPQRHPAPRRAAGAHRDLAGCSRAPPRPTARSSCASFLRNLEALYRAWSATGGDPAGGIRDSYVRRCVTIGSRVKVMLPGDEILEGHATGIDDLGRLLVDGRAISAGDVTHVRPAA